MRTVRPAGPASNERSPRHVASLRVMTGAVDPVVVGMSPIDELAPAGSEEAADMGFENP
jgi:hypothetical protein